MTVDIQRTSILRDEQGDEAAAFREVIAYLRGIADTVTAQSGAQGPLSLRPLSVQPLSLQPLSLRPALSLGPLSLRPSSMAPSTQPPSFLRSLSLSPLALAHAAGQLRLSTSPAPSERRPTLRFGELAVDGPEGWPQVPVGSVWEPTRGGARLIDPGSIRPLGDSDVGVIWRRTLPYGAPTVSLAACASPSSSPSASPWEDGERTSEVRLRAAELPREWYELTGTEARAGR